MSRQVDPLDARLRDARRDGCAVLAVPAQGAEEWSYVDLEVFARDPDPYQAALVRLEAKERGYA